MSVTPRSFFLVSQDAMTPEHHENGKKKKITPPVRQNRLVAEHAFLRELLKKEKFFFLFLLVLKVKLPTPGPLQG